MEGKCKFCEFWFYGDQEERTFKHVQKHGLLLCQLCNETFPYKEYGETLRRHFDAVKHYGFKFCNKKKCLNRIFQIGEDHVCYHPLAKKEENKKKKKGGRGEEAAGTSTAN